LGDFDVIVAGTESLTVVQPLDTTSAVVASVPSLAATYIDATYNLGDRDYLIEPHAVLEPIWLKISSMMRTTSAIFVRGLVVSALGVMTSPTISPILRSMNGSPSICFRRSLNVCSFLTPTTERISAWVMMPVSLPLLVHHRDAADVPRCEDIRHCEDALKLLDSDDVFRHHILDQHIEQALFAYTPHVVAGVAFGFVEQPEVEA
jgi:hypothetical protein